MNSKLKKFVSLVLVIFLLSLGSSVAFGQEPTEEPTDTATVDTSQSPTDEAAASPTDEATVAPTDEPTTAPTDEAAASPTDEAAASPTDEATVAPTDEATVAPTDEATAAPTDEATAAPTDEATEEPTVAPTEEPTEEPIVAPTEEPTVAPTETPTPEPTEETAPTVDTAEDIGASVIVDPPGQSSNVLIQNLSSNAATVNVKVYDTSGSVVKDESFSIAGNGARTVHAGSGTSDTGHLFLALSDAFQGSMVVNSTERVVAANINAGGLTGSTGVGAHSIYEGLDSSAGSTDILCPQIHWRSAQHSVVGIQNMDTGSVNVNIQYLNQDGTNARSVINVNIPEGSSNFRNSITDITPDQSPGVGTLRVTSTDGKNIGVTVLSTLSTKAAAYDCFPVSAGDTSWDLPSVHHNLNGQFSHILVQNLEGTAASVSITYKNQDGSVANTFSNVSIPANGSLTFHTTSDPSGDGVVREPTNLGNVGSASITSNKNVVVTVLEAIGFFPNISHYMYNGFNSAGGASTVLLPSVHHNTGGQFSHILVQNVASGSNNVQITYYNQDGTVANQFSKNLANGGAITFHTTSDASTDGIAREPTNLGNVGSATVTSLDGKNLEIIVIETIFGVPASYAGFAN